MSLTGNLEDLPLLDILQIVSFSQKTGFLTIQTVEGDGAISFREGLVVNAFTWESGSAESDQSTEDTHTQISSALERLARVSDGQFNFSLTPEPSDAYWRSGHHGRDAPAGHQSPGAAARPGARTR